MARGKNSARRRGVAGVLVQAGGGPSPAAAVADVAAVAGKPEPLAGPAGPLGHKGSSRAEPRLGIAVMSPWGWRILAVFTLVAAGLCLTFFLDGRAVYGALWVIVTGGWGTFAYRLWRSHLAWDRV